MKGRVKRIHFIGIGGVGMSGLAEILQTSGYEVSGSDLRASPATRRLETIGIRVAIGHSSENVGVSDVVVYSSAVSPRNPEIREAEAHQVPVIERAEMLAELMRMKDGVAIAGSHGKTTTTSLLGSVLQAGGLDPTIVVGGRVKSLGSNSVLGAGDVLVAEADESDGSFLRLAPSMVAITNIDREHLDHYGDFAALQAAFRDFANRVPFWGAAILCLDDPNIQLLLPEITRRSVTYGFSSQAEIRADRVEARDLRMQFRVLRGDEVLGEVSLASPGRHNVSNALAAVALGLEFDVPFAAIREGLEAFSGVERRFELRGHWRGAPVIDDYAHHPAEIQATLEAAQGGMGRRIVVAFQPHRYTRTRDLFEELAGSFHAADVLLVTEVYAAGEEKIPGVDAAALVEAVRGRGHREAHFVAEREAIVPRLRELARGEDAILFMGAGDIGRLASELLEGNAAD